MRMKFCHLSESRSQSHFIVLEGHEKCKTYIVIFTGRLSLIMLLRHLPVILLIRIRAERLWLPHLMRWRR